MTKNFIITALCTVCLLACGPRVDPIESGQVSVQFSLNASTATSGRDVLSTIYTKNNSRGALDVQLRFYLSTDAQYSPNDIQLLTITENLPARQENTLARLIKIPSGVREGDYYVVARYTADNRNFREQNQNLAVTVSNAEVTVTGVTAGQTFVRGGQATSVFVTCKSAAATAAKCTLYWSDDPYADLSDVFLNEKNTNLLPGDNFIQVDYITPFVPRSQTKFVVAEVTYTTNLIPGTVANYTATAAQVNVSP